MKKMNVKFSKGPGAISKHKSEDIEKSMGRIKKNIHMFFVALSDSFLMRIILVNIS